FWGTATQFGSSVAISGAGDTIVVGDPTRSSSNTQVWDGAVYIYLKPANGWVNASENHAFNLTGFSESPYESRYNGNFGATVGISADGATLVAGAPGGWPNRAYVFTLVNRVMPQWGARLMPSDTAIRFGGSITISPDGSTVVVGASSCFTGRLC